MDERSAKLWLYYEYFPECSNLCVHTLFDLCTLKILNVSRVLVYFVVLCVVQH